MNSDSRYIVGLDLGTTNCTLATIDTNSLSEETADAEIEITPFAVAQLVKAGEVGEAPLTPSFLYLPAEGEIAKGQLALPWAKDREFAVGTFARDHGSQVPTRLVSSAKSWLGHSGIDRQSPVLPWTAEEGFPKISPLDASARLLEHLRDAWNDKVAQRDKKCRLENQDIVLTVPASFDAVARELTVEAAHRAGLKNVTLFEEPQAAFYAWLHDSGAEWRKLVQPGDVALVVDVGGGTSDLTLIAVAEEDGDLSLTRLAVGNHLLLGGDNMDLTLAHLLAGELGKKGTKLGSAQMLQLWHACRAAKEKLFAVPDLESAPVTVLGKGRKLVGGTIKTELTRAMVEKALVDGFFPEVSLGDLPQQQRSMGLQELGLAYEADPAITKHLSAFLTRHAEEIAKARGGESPLPTALLFNGGVFQAEPLRSRVHDSLLAWSGGPIKQLQAAGLDLAVARGAAYYGLVRRGRGVRIRGGVARSYYVGVETSMPAVPGVPAPIKALCVVPQGTEEGTEATPTEREFGLVIGQPVEFRFLGSTERHDDTTGTIVDDWEDAIEELAPLRTTLAADDPEQAGRTVPVRLHCKVTEVGTLELWCQSRDGKEQWKLEFNVREGHEE